MADLGNQLGGAGEKAEGLAGAFDNLMNKAASLAGLEEKVLKANQKAFQSQMKIDKEKKKAIPLQKKMTIQLQQRLKNTTLLNKGLKETIKGMNVFGKTMAGLKGGLGAVGKGIGGIAKAGAIGGLVVGVKFLIDGLLKVDSAMAGMSKRLGVTRSQLAGVREVTEIVTMDLGKWGTTFEQVTAEAGNLAQQFGSLKYVTEDLIKTSFKLQQVYGVSAQAAGELLESLERTNKSSEEFINNIGMKAQKEGVLTSLVMKDLASQSQMIAIQSSRGVESMQNLAIEAAKAGGSLKDFQGLEDTYSNIESASAAIGEATTLMGSDIAKHMGNIQDLRMMYERGETDKILKRVQNATAATVKLNKEGNLVNMQGRELLRSELKVMAKLAGMEESAYKLMATSHLKEEQFIKLKAKIEKGSATAQERTLYKKLKVDKQIVAENERQNQVMKDRQTMIERLTSIATGVFERITLAFSAALGIDKTGKGSVSEAIDKLQAKVEGIFKFDTLQRDIAAGGGGIEGFVDAMATRLEPLMDFLYEGFIDAMSSAFEWIGNNVEVDLTNAISGGPVIQTKGQIARKGLEQYRQGDPFGGDMGANFSGALKGQSGGSMRTAMTTAGFTTAQEQAWFASQVDSGLSPTEVKKSEYTKMKRQKARLSQEAQDFGITDAAQIAEYVDDLYVKPTRNALGGVHRRGRAALVGEEGRGEVVVSRSALRSGIGVGGRAASALASIGVPGYFRGGMVEGVTRRQGLMTGFGSEASRGAQASAYQKEQGIQQAAMVNYWREYYENKRDGLNQPGKGKDGPSWLQTFFKENREELKQVKDIMLENQSQGAKEMGEGVFAAMSAWSTGMKTKDALKVGVRTGMAESMRKGGTMYNLFERSNEAMMNMVKSGTKTQATIAMGLQSMSVGIQSAMATYAQTGNMKAAKEQMKRSAVSGGVTMLATKLLGKDAMNIARGQMGIPAAAKGKYVNSPTLMMVGEEGRGEVVIPTERIRKGLPINAGVAAELGSIGVPGFANGGYTGRYHSNRYKVGYRPASMRGITGPPKVTPSADPYGIGGANESFMGGAKASGASAALSFAQVYMQTGNMRLAAQAGLEAGISMGATALLSIPPIPPGVGLIMGPMIGKAVAGPLGRRLGITGGQGKGRNRVLKSIEGHVKSGGIFDFGSPGGMRKNISQAVGGKENVPTQENYDKLVNKVGNSAVLKPLWQAGIDPSILVAAGSGKLRGGKAMNSFKAINTALYGSAGGDKYMKAMAVPQLANGGIVTKPTTAVVGEAGPEMVIPLTEQRQSNDNMIKELKEQNKLMRQMIKTQEETGKTEVRLDGRVIAQSTAENFYDIGNGL